MPRPVLTAAISCLAVLIIGVSVTERVRGGEPDAVRPQARVASPDGSAQGDSADRVAGSEKAPPEETVQRLPSEHLSNLVRVHAKVVSGGLPDSAAAFQELARLGVRTVISVDGTRPDVKLARQYGLRYIHLPHGYDGISRRRARELGKAVMENDGLIYIHCHHGRHRSPAAACVACRTAGLIDAPAARDVLRLAGTDPAYRGLFQAVRQTEPVPVEELRKLSVTFREIAPVAPLAEAMVRIEHLESDLSEVAAAGWTAPPEHPDLDPAHQALLLREQFAELMRREETREYPPEFSKLLSDSAKAAGRLEQSLRRWSEDGSRKPAPSQFDRLAARIHTNCKTCHRRFRDVPRQRNF